MDYTFWVITIGSFVAGFVNAAFATGGVYVLLAASASVFPMTTVVPLQSVFAFSSLMGRVYFFWQHINWPMVKAVVLGAAIGVTVGTLIFVNLNERMIAICLGALLLFWVWMPKFNTKLSVKHPFFYLGILHSFLATMFGVGALLQPAVLRTDLKKLQITGTLAAMMLTLDIFKIIGYLSIGFDYTDYIPHIIGASIAGVLGTWVGKRITHHISETLFRTVFKSLITVVAIRLLYRGIF